MEKVLRKKKHLRFIICMCLRDTHTFFDIGLGTAIWFLRKIYNDDSLHLIPYHVSIICTLPYTMACLEIDDGMGSFANAFQFIICICHVWVSLNK